MSDQVTGIECQVGGSRGATSLQWSEVAWTRRTFLLLLALCCVRVAYLAVVPLDLCPDEAYYWDWSRRLDWGYYSKPPMIAWIIALATSLGGDSEFVIRLPAAVLGTFGLWPVFALGRDIFSARVGFWASVAVAATPGMAAMNLLMTIDAPFLCAWAFAVWCVWRAFCPLVPSPPSSGERERVRVRGTSGAEVSPGTVEAGRATSEHLASESHVPSSPLTPTLSPADGGEGTGNAKWRWLVAAILCTGLGLLSKQTMLGLFPLVLIWLASDAVGRRHLVRPVVWLWIAGSLLFLTPVVWWNWRHGWITVQHTREHFQSKATSLWQHIGQGAEFWAGQLGVVSPVSGGLMVTLGIAGLVSWWRLDHRLRFLLCLSAVPMLGVTGLSLAQRVQPNWPAAFHLTAFVLLAAWGCGVWQSATRLDRARRWFPIGVACGAVLVIGIYAVPFAVPRSSWAGSAWDATVRLRGWKALGHEVGEKLSSFPDPQNTLVIAATSRSPVSALAYYLPGQPHVYRWNPVGLIDSQHEIWGGPRGGVGANALIVTQRERAVPAQLAAAFDTVESTGTVEVPLGGSRREVLSVWRGTGYRGWPGSRSINGAGPHTAMATPPNRK